MDRRLQKWDISSRPWLNTRSTSTDEIMIEFATEFDCGRRDEGSRSSNMFSDSEVDTVFGDEISRNIPYLCLRMVYQHP